MDLGLIKSEDVQCDFRKSEDVIVHMVQLNSVFFALRA